MFIYKLSDDEYIRLKKAACQWYDEPYPAMWMINVFVKTKGYGGKVTIDKTTTPYKILLEMESEHKLLLFLMMI